jgi:hypothetical protein
VIRRAPGRAVAATLAAVLCGGAVAGCGGGEQEDAGPEPGQFEGAWDVTLVVGAVDADAGADPASFPGDASFRERWVFEDCNEAGCTLRRPDSGLLLGDLDGVDFELRADPIADEDRFRGEGEGADLVLPGDDDHEPDPCAGTDARRWTVLVEVSVADRVLSGTVLRRPLARTVEAGGTTCYGIDLTLGLSGIPAVGAGTPSG